MNRRTIITFAVLLTTVSACACSEKKPLPEPGDFIRYTETMTMHSDILGTDIYFGVYLPESYRDEPDRRYPVVYMLHGFGDNWKSWNGKYLHANYKVDALTVEGLSEMIYIFPSGFTTYYCNFYNGKYNYMDMFVQEFIPHVDKCFRTIADKGHRSITGYSMGGFGAMALAEMHPEMFCCSAPLSMSFRTNAQYMSESQNGWDSQWGSIFGGTGKAGADRLTEHYLLHCPYYRFNDANRSSLETVNWFLTCGDDEEQLLIANDSLHVVLRDRNFAHEYRVKNGAHTSSYWMDALNEVLPWFDHCMNGTPAPSDQEIWKADIQPGADGTVSSTAFQEKKSGSGVFFFHKGLKAEEVKDAMAVLWSAGGSGAFVFLPCNLSEKSVEQWEEFYSKSYEMTSRTAVALDGSGDAVIARKTDFKSVILANTGTSLTTTAPGEIYRFASADDAACYHEMSELYKSCKRSGASFEYRVFNGSGNPSEDRLRALYSLREYITY